MRALPCLSHIKPSQVQLSPLCGLHKLTGSPCIGEHVVQRWQGLLPNHAPDVVQGEYYREIEPVKERLFRELFAEGQIHRLAELGIGTGPNQGFYACQQASLLPPGRMLELLSCLLHKPQTENAPPLQDA